MRTLILLTLFSLFWVGCTRDTVDLTPEPIPQDTIEIELCDTLNAGFSAEINPIIQTNCATSGCHDANSANGNFTSYQGLKLKVESGAFRERVVVQQNMPPSGPLPDEEIQKITCWLDKGAPNN